MLAKTRLRVYPRARLAMDYFTVIALEKKIQITQEEKDS
jgi:hypothetical protein